MSYCQSQAFSPMTFVREKAEQINLISLIYITQGLYVMLGLYIIFKMCKLCSKAFSYSNFHIHQTYKFYTLALISTIMILVSRTVQVQFASKITHAKLNPDDETPFRKNPYYQGWILFNEVTGIISVYTVNLMYALAGVTWLMIAHKCDFNRRDDAEKGDQEDEERRVRDRRFYGRVRIGLLYGFIPVAMILSVCGQLHYTRDWCLTSKILTIFTNLFVYLLFIYSLLNFFLLRLRDQHTPIKHKLIWLYLIIVITIRQCSFWILTVQDLTYPSECDYVPIKGQNNVISNISVFLYSVVVTTVPIFLLSYMADRQLEGEKGVEGERSERIVYSSTII